MVTSKTTILFGAVATLVMAATVLAQDIQNQVQRREAAEPVIANRMLGRTNSADNQLAACLIVDNQGEIALGKLAQQRAKDSEVKQFAEKMVQDHSQFLQQLERFSSSNGEGTNLRADNKRPGDTTLQPPIPGSADRPIAASPMQPMGSQVIDFVSLKQQIGQRCLELVRRDLEEKEGSQFDKCYIGGQIGAHMHVLATLEVFRTQASPEFAALLDRGIETTKTHLDHAQKIAKSLDRESSTDTARRGSTSRN